MVLRLRERRKRVRGVSNRKGIDRGGAHRERADDGATAPNPACPVADFGWGAVKWNRGEG
jgi:hypothetical protein